MHARALVMAIAVGALAVVLAGCSPANEVQVGATVPPSLPPIGTRIPPQTPTATPTPSPQPTKVAETAPAKRRLPAIFRREPNDPKEAFRVLTARGNYARSQRRFVPMHFMYVPGTKIYNFHRADDKEAVKRGIRLVGGRTEFEMDLLSRSADQAVIEVRDRDVGWTKLYENGKVEHLEDNDGHYVVWLTRLEEGWRIRQVVMAN